MRVLVPWDWGQGGSGGQGLWGQGLWGLRGLSPGTSRLGQLPRVNVCSHPCATDSRTGAVSAPLTDNEPRSARPVPPCCCQGTDPTRARHRAGGHPWDTHPASCPQLPADHERRRSWTIIKSFNGRAVERHKGRSSGEPAQSWGGAHGEAVGSPRPQAAGPLGTHSPAALSPGALKKGVFFILCSPNWQI